MTLTLVTAPAALPISLEDVKLHARVDSNDEDERIKSFIEAAVERLDGRDGQLGICLITQQWKLTLDAFANAIALPLPPCQSVESITYVDDDGATQTLGEGTYQVTGLRSIDGAKVHLAYGASWPSVRAIPEAIAITFTAGFGDDEDAIPEAIRTDIAMCAARLYENREGMPDPDASASYDSDELTRNYKQFVF